LTLNFDFLRPGALPFLTCFPFNCLRLSRRRHLNGAEYSAETSSQGGAGARIRGHTTCKPPATAIVLRRLRGSLGGSWSVPLEVEIRRAAQRDRGQSSEKAFNAHRYQLTLRNLCHYSSTMDSELGDFERKLFELVEACHRLRADNQRLRKELSESRSEVRQFQERIEGARARLERIVEQIPDQAP
jgi:cell division protein ZapB